MADRQFFRFDSPVVGRREALPATVKASVVLDGSWIIDENPAYVLSMAESTLG